MDLSQAACRDCDLNLFYGADGEGRSNKPSKARSICFGCPVRPECLALCLLEEAVCIQLPHRGRQRYRHGVRGGMSPPERNRLMAGDGWPTRWSSYWSVDTRLRFENSARSLGLECPPSTFISPIYAGRGC